MRASLLITLCLVAFAASAKVGIKRAKHRLHYLHPVPESRIVNGEAAVPHSRPFQVSFQIDFFGDLFHSCGGSIMDEMNVITGAHCCDGQSANDLTIVAGEHHLYDNTDDGTEQLLAVDSLILHPEYSRLTIDNDICLVKLASPITLNE